MRGVLPAFLVDLGCVLLFALVGRASHAEQVTVAGVLQTAWPFVVGLVAGWAVVRVARKDWPREVTHAVPIWLSTVSVGLILRVASGTGGAPLGFVLVASVVLGALLLGWRALAAVIGFADRGLQRRAADLAQRTPRG